MGNLCKNGLQCSENCHFPLQIRDLHDIGNENVVVSYSKERPWTSQDCNASVTSATNNTNTPFVEIAIFFAIEFLSPVHVSCNLNGVDVLNYNFML